MMTRVCQTPPKKNSKKIFGGPTFFSRKKFFWFAGFCHHGFLFKTKPVSSWVFGPKTKPVSSWVSVQPIVSPQTPRVTPEISMVPLGSAMTPSGTPQGLPWTLNRLSMASPWLHDTHGFARGFKNRVPETFRGVSGEGSGTTLELHDTRGRSRGIRGRRNGGGGIDIGDMTRQGFIRPKPMMTRFCKTPPEKKFQKKFFEVQLFFQEKIFCGFGGFRHHGFFI